jgi:hypothetical protein
MIQYDSIYLYIYSSCPCTNTCLPMISSACPLGWLWMWSASEGQQAPGCVRKLLLSTYHYVACRVYTKYLVNPTFNIFNTQKYQTYGLWWKLMACSIYRNIQNLRDFTPKKAWPSATTMTYAMAWEHCWQSASMTHSHKPQERSHQRLVATWSQSVAVCRPSGSGTGSPASRLQKFLAFFTELHIEHLRTWTTNILCDACGVSPSRIATRLHSFSDSNDWEQRIAQTLCSHSYSFMSKETLDVLFRGLT